jgi:hypothetical protein
VTGDDPRAALAVLADRLLAADAGADIAAVQAALAVASGPWEPWRIAHPYGWDVVPWLWDSDGGWTSAHQLYPALQRLLIDGDPVVAKLAREACRALGWQRLAGWTGPGDEDRACVWVQTEWDRIAPLGLAIRNAAGRSWWSHNGDSDTDFGLDHALAAIDGWEPGRGSPQEELDRMVGSLWPAAPAAPAPTAATIPEVVAQLEFILSGWLYFGWPWPYPAYGALLEQLQPIGLWQRSLFGANACTGHAYELQVLVRAERWSALLVHAATTG